MSTNSFLSTKCALLLLDFPSMMGSKGKFSRKVFSGKIVKGEELNKKLSTELVLFGITAFDRSRAISQIEERTYGNEESIKRLAKAFDTSACRNDSKRFFIQEVRKVNQFDNKFSGEDLVQCFIRNGNAAENINILRKWALNILVKSKSKPDQSIKSIMRKNAMSFKHLVTSVKKIFHA